MSIFQTFNSRNPINPEDFESADTLIRRSLPDNEIRSKDGQKALLRNPAYHLSVLKNDAGTIIAALATWDFQFFVFGEHLAVDESVRNGGIGSKIIQEFLKNLRKPWVIEVELPDSELASRRIKLYERNGLHLNDYEYFQPPMQPQYPPLPLRLMTYPTPMTADELEAIKTVLYREVYKR